MMRFFVCAAFAGVMASAGPARAEGTLDNGAELTFDKQYIEVNGQLEEPTDPEELRFHLNRAHCVCSQNNAGMEQRIAYDVRLSVVTGTNRPAEVWVGTNCKDDTTRAMSCRKTGTIADIDQLVTTPEKVAVTLYDAVNGQASSTDCREDEGDAPLWLLVDTNGDGTFEYSQTRNVGTDQSAGVTGYDTQRPPLPTNFSASSAENSVVVSWTLPEARATDIFYFQALCVGPDGLPAKQSGLSPKYQTASTLCGIPLGEPDQLSMSEIDADGQAATFPAAIDQLDPAYLCGQSTSASATSLRIDGLENGVPYSVALLVIDDYGNVVGTKLSQTITPAPAIDFWEDLHDRGSDIEGGVCLIAQTYGDDSPLTDALRAFRDETLADSVFGRWLTDVYYATLARLGAAVQGSLALRIIAGVLLAPLVVVALAWYVLTLPGLLGLLAAAWLWRRRHPWLVRMARSITRPSVAGASALALVIGLPALGHAQGFEPYWEDQASTQTSADDDVVKWVVGLRLGPYLPDIDKQFREQVGGTMSGPYLAMYGGYRITPMIDVDRILWRGFGQLGVGLSAGYLQKSGRSFKDGTDPADPNRPRSEGDTNTFRLFPLGLTAIYRFTVLDEQYGVPIVPYVRAGLGYYVWWIRTNGRTATACWDGTKDPDCDKDYAYGASAGYQGAIGIAIRAERVDPDAASSMRQSGIHHAGFYGELSMAKMDGFGKDTKLSVGDTTWFAGVNFEF
ncbi:MAG: MXAN_2562 family outer membrane beta-barrel protein [Kofleriaceae bacterium]